MKKVTAVKDNKVRCAWCTSDEVYIEYHDKEWGVSVHDDQKLFEFIVLESFQAGLSWLTILKKRENFRKAFAGFDIKKVAKFDEKKVASLMQDEGIIRNSLKINAAINNAKRVLEVQKEFGSFNKYIWSFTGGKPLVNHPKTMRDLTPTTDISKAMTKDLLKRGFKFVGGTICYAFMQAVGIVDDHTMDCWKKSRKS
ncbi:MAG: DNA-3-methyladenine glycosylase [Bacteroidetes bacterium]|nr:DNA-3-methyladenine glycosylase [Bacteroidota bacterium]